MLQEWDGEKEMLMTVQARIPFQFFPWLKSPFRVFLSPVSSFTDHPHFQTSYFKFWTKLPMAKGKHHSSVFVSCSITLFTILPAFSLSSVFFPPFHNLFSPLFLFPYFMDLFPLSLSSFDLDIWQASSYTLLSPTNPLLLRHTSNTHDLSPTFILLVGKDCCECCLHLFTIQHDFSDPRQVV